MSRMLSTLLASVLVACALSACGAAPAPEPKTDPSPAETPAATGAQTGAETAEFGHLGFTTANSDYIIDAEAEALELVAEAYTAYLDDDFEVKALIDNPKSETDFAIVFRSDDAERATDERVNELFDDLTGNDLHASLIGQDGTIVNYTYSLDADDIIDLTLIEQDADGLWLVIAASEDPEDLLGRWSVDSKPLIDVIAFTDFNDTQRIGTDEIGYVVVPASWVPFSDLNAGDSVYQYSDTSGKNVVTMYTVTPEEAGFDGSIAELALAYASKIYEDYDGRDDVTVEGADEESLDGMDGFWFTSSWDDGTVMSSYFMAGEDRVYVINVEGDEATVAAMDDMVYGSFSRSETITGKLTGTGGGQSANSGAKTPDRSAPDAAKSYLDSAAFSRDGLIDMLEFEGFSHDEAVSAVDGLGADWNEQALECAKSYLEYIAFSESGLIDQLEFEGFTSEEAAYGVSKCGADWNEQAVACAKSYLESNPSSTREEDRKSTRLNSSHRIASRMPASA